MTIEKIKVFSISFCFVFLVSACGIDVDVDRYYDFDIVLAESGLSIKAESTDFSFYNDLQQLALIYNEWYYEVSECLGFDPGIGPSIYIVDSFSVDVGDTQHFKTFAITWLNDYGRIEVLADYSYLSYVLKHEFIHYLLLNNGISDDINASHDDRFFGNCEYL